MRIRRILVVVLDGVGIGALPDAASYGDAGSNTLGNLAERVGGLSLPVMEGLGLGAIASIRGLKTRSGAGIYGRMAEASAGKDSSTGHWELAGLEVTSPFMTFPRGFPRQVTEALRKRTGRSTLGNRPASGTVIIEELGAEHLATGSLILYTSADSVLQLAAHEAVVPAEGLYDYCRSAREILDELDLPVIRVIARPFTGEPGRFRRTPGRRDFSLPPPGKTVLETLRDRGTPVLGIGKVGDLYCGKGLDECWKTSGNVDGLQALTRALRDWPRGLVLANLLDFDTLYGHRNDAPGFAGALERFDSFLGESLLPSLRPGDVLFITADHGCDPTAKSTDHSREYVPLLGTAPGLGKPAPVGTRETFADLGATVFEALGEGNWERGKSFWPRIASLW